MQIILNVKPVIFTSIKKRKEPCALFKTALQFIKVVLKEGEIWERKTRLNANLKGHSTTPATNWNSLAHHLEKHFPFIL